MLFEVVQKMGILGKKYVGQIVFRQTVWDWKTRVICPNCPVVGQLFMQKKSDSSAMSISPMVGHWQCCVQLSMLNDALSKYLLVGKCCVQQSNGWSMLCPTVLGLVSWASNSPMVGLCFFRLSNGRTVLCPTVRRSDNAISNCPMVGQYSVQHSNGYSMLCQT